MNWIIYYCVVGLLVLLTSALYTLKIEEQHLTWKSGLIILGLALIWPAMLCSLLAILGGGLFLYVCDRWQPGKGKVIIHSKKKAAREMADRMLHDEGPEPAYTGVVYGSPQPGNQAGKLINTTP